MALKIFYFIFCNFIKKGFLQRILQDFMEKKILGTSDAWSTSCLSHQPSKPAYHIVVWRILTYTVVLYSRSCRPTLGLPSYSYVRAQNVWSSFTWWWYLLMSVTTWDGRNMMLQGKKCRSRNLSNNTTMYPFLNFKEL